MGTMESSNSQSVNDLKDQKKTIGYFKALYLVVSSCKLALAELGFGFFPSDI